MCRFAAHLTSAFNTKNNPVKRFSVLALTRYDVDIAPQS